MNSKSYQRSQRVTMKDVAIESGVSQSTVSFVLNGLDNMRISDETRNKVIKAANKLGYRRRAVGRPPVNSGHEVIGVMFDEVATSPFAAISIEGIQEEAWKNNILVEVVMTGGDRAYETAILRKWSNDQVLGVVYGSILTRIVTPPIGLEQHRSVLLNCYDTDGKYLSVVPAERRGGEDATKALIAEGYKRIAFISGEVARVNKLGQVIWLFKNEDLLNTPVKIFNDYLIILYPENIVFLSILSGDIIYEKAFKSSNIIQSSGGKIENYFNIIFFLLPNSEFNSLDTYLFEEHRLNFDNIELNTSLNNLKDQIHIYKNFLVYFDNGNIIHTYDINKDKFVLVDLVIKNSSSAILFNNSLISKNENFIEFYNIKNGNLFSRIKHNKKPNMLQRVAEFKKLFACG